MWFTLRQIEVFRAVIHRGIFAQVELGKTIQVPVEQSRELTSP
jgi:hypothetical protein